MNQPRPRSRTCPALAGAASAAAAPATAVLAQRSAGAADDKIIADTATVLARGLGRL
ncbi:hypothetical protein [Actinomadura alba]|uniref:Uncharacterized protein n=1 Tax=Actinomadura alba TaxID=406431 RepID=A0ABR7LS34_9ACTN|nr:hypothetical protein [Actinomadura alba]MBC6467337.1 hypothetical protein [Actinomadura alba]